MRGKANPGNARKPNARITPAYAGKRPSPSWLAFALEDHPRVCGEKMVSMIPHRRSRGSPPRMRGKGVIHVFVAEKFRITPAYAGKSSPGSAAGCHARDHHRVCGEKPPRYSGICTVLGSPLRVRGKGVVHILVPEPLGITPAYAGKRGRRPFCGRRGWDHPRVCGEKKKLSPNFTVYEGSPPRVRGKETRLPPLRAPAGITPACAGKSCSSSVSSSQRMSWTIRSRI